MTARGFTLIEVLVVIVIMAILMSIATMQFTTWSRKSQVERQVHELYADLQAARMDAAFTKRNNEMEFTATQVIFRRYSSAADPGTIVQTKNLPMNIAINFDSTNPNSRILFDSHGVMTASAPPMRLICFRTIDDVAADAILVSQGLTGLGQMLTPLNRGGNCDLPNVIQK